MAQSCLTLCNPMDCSMPGFPGHHQLLEIAQTHIHQLHNAIQPLILCRTFLYPPSIFPSIRSFPLSTLHIRWLKHWSFSFSNLRPQLTQKQFITNIHSVLSPIQNKIWFSQHLLPSVAQNAEIEELPKLLVSQFTVRWHSKGAASTQCGLGTDRRSPWFGWCWA